jgi:thiol-disulfide isomerase/thioredoxin
LSPRAIHQTNDLICPSSQSKYFLKGKYVLIDFWGSWCILCCKSFPHLKRLYEKYRAKDFEIIGVAQELGTAENAEAAWKKAIIADGLPWIQVLSNQFKDNMDIVSRYGVISFPTQILIDRQGKVVLKNVGGGISLLERKLEELL